MHITKFLLIDSVLVIAAIPLLFLVRSGKKIYPLLQNSNKKELLRKTSIKLPDKEKILKLEKLAKDQGSGIGIDSLIGDWKFVSVWKKDKDEEDSLFSSLLRFFSAKMEIKKDTSTDGSCKFPIVVSIKFGILKMGFSGSCFLSGEQPLLPYLLNVIELKSGSNILLSKSLQETTEEGKSFFALIALEESGEWLSARNQVGDLVLWLKD